MTFKKNTKTLNWSRYRREEREEETMYIPSWISRHPVSLLYYSCFLAFFSGNSLLIIDSMKLLTLRNGFLSWIPKSTAIFCFECSLAFALGLNCFGFALASFLVRHNVYINYLAFLGFLCHSLGWILLSLYRDFQSLVLAFILIACGNSFVYVSLQFIANMFTSDRMEFEILALLSVADSFGTISPKALTSLIQLYPLNSSSILFFWSIFLFFLAQACLFVLPYHMPGPRQRPIYFWNINKKHTKCFSLMKIQSTSLDIYSILIDFKQKFRSIFSITSHSKETRNILLNGERDCFFVYPEETPKNYLTCTRGLKNKLVSTGFDAALGMERTTHFIPPKNGSSSFDDLVWEALSSKDVQAVEKTEIPPMRMYNFHKFQGLRKRKNNVPRRKSTWQQRLLQVKQAKLSCVRSTDFNSPRTKVKSQLDRTFYHRSLQYLRMCYAPKPSTYFQKLARFMFFYPYERQLLSHDANKRCIRELYHDDSVSSQNSSLSDSPSPSTSCFDSDSGVLLPVGHSLTQINKSEERRGSNPAMDLEKKVPILSKVSKVDGLSNHEDAFCVSESHPVSSPSQYEFLKNRTSDENSPKLFFGYAHIFIIFLILSWIQLADLEALMMMRPLINSISSNVRVADFYLHSFELLFSSLPQAVLFFLFVGPMAHVYLNWRGLICILGIMNFFILLCFQADLTGIVWVQFVAFVSIFLFHFLLRGYGLLISLYLYGPDSFSHTSVSYSLIFRGMGCFVWILWHSFCVSTHLFGLATRIGILTVIGILVFIVLSVLYFYEPPIQWDFAGLTTIHHTSDSMSSGSSLDLGSLSHSPPKIPACRSSVSVILGLVPLLPPHLLTHRRCFQKGTC